MNVVSQPDQKDIKNFESLIHSKWYDEMLSRYDASAEELSRLCCTRWVSGDHMSLITQTMNSMQEKTFCIYFNFTQDASMSFSTIEFQKLKDGKLHLKSEKESAEIVCLTR